MKILAYCFSATGNTDRAVRLVRDALAAAGHDVAFRPIVKGSELDSADKFDAFLLAFPVFSFAPPVFVQKFIRSLESGQRGDGSRVPVFVLAVDGGGGMGADMKAARLLTARGYNPVVVGGASYPENWTEMAEPPTLENAAAMTAVGDAMAAAFARQVSRSMGTSVSGLPASSVPPAKSGPSALGIVSFLFGAVGRRFLGKAFFADGDCDGCGLCARQCPSATILMLGSGKGRPFWKSDCESCNRCINLCPRRAIVTSWGRIIVLFGFIVLSAWGGIRLYLALGTAPLTAALSSIAPAAVNTVVIALIVILAHVLYFPIDRLLLRRLERLPGIKRFFGWTFNKTWRRYKAKGFKPTAIEPNG